MTSPAVVRRLALLLVLLLAPGARAQAPASASAPSAVTSSSAAPAAAPSGAPRWLPWALLGLGVASTAGTLVAFAQREQHATRWNSASCVEPGRARGSVCPDELDAIHAWDRVLWVSGASAVVFLGGAVLTRSLEPARAPEAATAACHFGWGMVACGARF